MHAGAGDATAETREAAQVPTCWLSNKEEGRKFCTRTACPSAWSSVPET